MFVNAISLIFLFFVPLCLLRNFIYSNFFANKVYVIVRKFGESVKLDLKYRKVLLDINLLDTLPTNNLIPKFIQIRVSNKDFRNLKTYRQCQIKQEISNKKKK